MAKPIRKQKILDPLRFWHRESRVKGIDNPRGLKASCAEYFDWAHENDLEEVKVFAFKGDSWNHEVARPRAFSLHALCVFLGISRARWEAMKVDEELAEVQAWAEDVIYQQKFELAAAELLNPSFIARDLGLADKRELGGIPGQPLGIAALTPEELDKELEARGLPKDVFEE